MHTKTGKLITNQTPFFKQLRISHQLFVILIRISETLIHEANENMFLTTGALNKP